DAMQGPTHQGNYSASNAEGAISLFNGAANLAPAGAGAVPRSRRAGNQPVPACLTCDPRATACAATVAISTNNPAKLSPTRRNSGSAVRGSDIANNRLVLTFRPICTTQDCL